jgi:hypothetical protein
MAGFQVITEAKGKTFYKTAGGRFGLLEFKSTTEEMRLPNTAA